MCDFVDGQVIYLPDENHDWCHLCGRRSNLFYACDIPHNAEHAPHTPGRYLRMCRMCVETMRLAVDEFEDKQKRGE